MHFQRKIKKRNWVLQECLERVPDNIDAARELLQFGLKGTDLSATVMISQGSLQILYFVQYQIILNLQYCDLVSCFIVL